MGAGLQDEEEEGEVMCIVCHNGETKPGTTTVAFHREGRTLIVSEVPADVCENCSEAYVDEETTRRVLEIAAEAERDQATVLVRAYASTAA
ncbi:MAG: type II toxin-antitoxin system MqsA family antitoxin [Acidimicrobiia bacterium]